ncbi:MAG: AtpZ/AtpI family protein [Thermaerobacterales bacterium]
MNAEQDRQGEESKDAKLAGTVGRKAHRRVRARLTRDRTVWFGLGMFGMVGWTIAITTLLGVFLGIWIDRTWSGPYSWTLTMFMIGLIVGCMNAWYWVTKEGRIDDDDNDHE